jgi:hypothetical protein
MKPNIRIAPIDAWGTLQVTTAVAGTTYTALASNPAREVRLSNTTGTTVDVRQVGTTDSPYKLVTAASEVFRVVGNTNEIEVKRADDSATPVTISAIFSK